MKIATLMWENALKELQRSIIGSQYNTAGNIKGQVTKVQLQEALKNIVVWCVRTSTQIYDQFVLSLFRWKNVN